MIENLTSLIDYHDQQIASRSLSKKLGLDQQIILYAFDKDESISKEESVCDKLVQVLEGQLEISLDQESISLASSGLIAIQEGQIYSLKALEKSKVLLTNL